MDTSFDAAVIGVGGIGSAALFHLARRGLRVIGLDQFQIAHDRGSSHGQTRLIRQAYFEHPSYVPLLKRSYTLWNELERQTNDHLFQQVGLIEIGPPDGEILPGVRTSAEEHALPIEPMTADASRARFPMFRIPNGMEAIFEPTAGLLYVERCVAAHVSAAKQCDANVSTNTLVRRIDLDQTPIAIHTTRDVLRAHRLIICGGAWTDRLLNVDLPLRLVRKHLHWFPTARPHQANVVCPAFFYELPSGQFYGFPPDEDGHTKAAEHSGGETVDDPDQLNRDDCQEMRARVTEFLQANLTGVARDPARHTVCMYTLTPDHHFIIDRHPHHDHVAFAAGLSGHGFKFAPVLGEILAELVLDKGTEHAIGFFGGRRFS